MITGAHSYIGESLENWLSRSDQDYQVDTLDMLNPEWKKYDFSSYDSIFHVAGIAHFSKDPSQKDLYYKVNTELTETVAKKAKEEGANQFIFMSSIIIYGDSTKADRVITKDTVPKPSDFYGDSKWQAEKKLNQLADSKFKVAIVRPPMIYGKASKGNYPRLSKLSRSLPIIPDYQNKRSMLYIGNLCEFLKQVIDRKLDGVFFPQNENYVCTSDLMYQIANSHGKNPVRTKIFNPLIKSLFFSDNVKKMFGNLVYEKSMSDYGFEYRFFDFEESIMVTEEDN
nr:NAD-dependent epimerase/dehydratase family protein [Streptococcus catagoni]